MYFIDYKKSNLEISIKPRFTDLKISFTIIPGLFDPDLSDRHLMNDVEDVHIILFFFSRDPFIDTVCT